MVSAMYDSSIMKLIPDTSGTFPISFIAKEGKRVSMYGHRTHYPTKMKLIGNYYFSNNLVIPTPGDSIRRRYIFSSYYFYPSKTSNRLIIKNKIKTDTIYFIKSQRKFNDINVVWG